MTAERGACGPVFPLPFLSAPRRPTTRSRRSAGRYRRSMATVGVANAIVSSINFLYGVKRTPLSRVLTSDMYVSRVQARFLAQVRSAAYVYVRRQRELRACSLRGDRGEVSTSSTSGGNSSRVCHVRPLFPFHPSSCSLDLAHKLQISPPLESSSPAKSPSKLDSFEYQLDEFDLDARLPYGLRKSAVVPLRAERLALPERAGSVDLLSALPPDLAERYACPEAILNSEPRRPQPCCAVQDFREYVKVVLRLRAASMVVFRRSAKEVNGIFAVHKSDASDRLIMDDRRVNARCRTPPKTTLPSPSQLGDLCLPRGYGFVVGKTDLSNFYHTFRTPEWLWEYMALPPVRAEEVGVAGEFGKGTLVYPLCTTLPMGWSHAVALAQAAHLHMIRCASHLSPRGMIGAGMDLRLDRPRHAVYIDDLPQLHPAKGHRCPQVALRAHEQLMVDYARAGFLAQEKKCERPTADGVDVLGIEMHGRLRRAGVGPLDAFKLSCDVRSLLRLGACTGKVLHHLVGRCVWFMLLRRCALSVFSAAFRFIEVAGTRTFQIWPSVREEMLAAVGLLPLLFSRLDAEWCPRVVATDASKLAEGVSASDWREKEIVEVASLPALPGDGRDSKLPHVDSVRWRTIVSSRWSWDDHINTLELAALIAGVRWQVSSPQAVGKRLLALCDSTVVVGAVSKGRSSSPSLRVGCRRLAAWLLASGTRLYVRWLPTDQNPADAPSRLVAHRGESAVPGGGVGDA